jgi:hypothetical protein
MQYWWRGMNQEVLFWIWDKFLSPGVVVISDFEEDGLGSGEYSL